MRAAVALRGSDLDRALFCGADPARVLADARREPVPRTVAPALTQTYRDMLVYRVQFTVNLRGSNADNPDCLALKQRADLAPLWAPAPRATPTPARRPAPAT